MKRIIILNPQSRHGTAAEIFESQRGEWENLLGEFDLYHTKAPGDATDKVRSVLQGREADQILIAGGDGSINEAFRGYWDDGEILDGGIPLGIINFGTGGDFFRTVQACSEDYDEALKDNRFRKVDSGRVIDTGGNEHRFVNISSVGMAGEMLRQLKGSRFQAGAAAYFLHTLKTLLRFHPRRAEIEWLDKEGREQSQQVDLLNFFVCNGRFSGGGMQWAPDAELDSGLFRVTLIGGKKKWPLIWHSRKLYAGQIDSFPGARTFETTQVTVKCAESVSLETDGEIVDDDGSRQSEICFRVIPKEFPLIL